MPLGRYMEICNAHYYAARDPLGAAGDFTTAPEISQMFGEMIGTWCADRWLQIGSPEEFTLLECGPGRGTLMADLLRITKAIPGFHEAARIVLLETSPVLREKQRAALRDHKVQWVDDLKDVEALNAPLIVIANEFLDALPVEQEVSGAQRVVKFEDGALGYHPSGKVTKEYAPVREAWTVRLCNLLKDKRGAALIIDYGYEKGGGDTFQAVQKHEFVDPLTAPGTADLTAHVDFAALRDIAKSVGIDVLGPAGQGRFLHDLGIGLRAAQLAKNANTEQCQALDAALHRLCGHDQMGHLFKVVQFTA